MDKDDKKMVDKTVKNPRPAGNVSEEHSMTTVHPQSLAAQVPGIPIGGFQELPLSMLALPYVVIVQGLTDVYLTDGKTPAPKGQWYFNDVRTTQEEIHFISLRAKVVVKEVLNDKTGLMEKRQKLYALCANMEDMELFIMVLPVTSFTAWGRMMAQMKKNGVKDSFEYSLLGKVVKAVNKRGHKYFVGDFILEEKLSEETMKEMKSKYGQYGGVLDRSEVVEEGEVE